MVFVQTEAGAEVVGTRHFPFWCDHFRAILRRDGGVQRLSRRWCTFDRVVRCQTLDQRDDGKFALIARLT